MLPRALTEEEIAEQKRDLLADDVALAASIHRRKVAALPTLKLRTIYDVVAAHGLERAMLGMKHDGSGDQADPNAALPTFSINLPAGENQAVMADLIALVKKQQEIILLLQAELERRRE